jgi:hypothetical protein
MAVKRPNSNKFDQNLPLYVPPKFTQIRIFGLKKCHLATLLPRRRGKTGTGKNIIN